LDRPIEVRKYGSPKLEVLAGTASNRVSLFIVFEEPEFTHSLQGSISVLVITPRQGEGQTFMQKSVGHQLTFTMMCIGRPEGKHADFTAASAIA
jgi:hypothetical protein